MSIRIDPQVEQWMTSTGHKSRYANYHVKEGEAEVGDANPVKQHLYTMNPVKLEHLIQSLGLLIALTGFVKPSL